MSLENHFHDAMLSIYDKAKLECDYKPTRFLRMIRKHGGFETAKRLLHRKNIPPGLFSLSKLNRLDLSMEALILEPRWQNIFTDKELHIARKRLQVLGYYK